MFEDTRIEGHSPVAPNTSICSDIITQLNERIKSLDLHETERDKTGILVDGRVYWKPVENHTIYWVLRRNKFLNLIMVMNNYRPKLKIAAAAQPPLGPHCGEYGRPCARPHVIKIWPVF